MIYYNINYAMRDIIKRIDNYLGNFFSLETNDFIIKSFFHSKMHRTKKMSNLEWHNYIKQNFTNKSLSPSFKPSSPPPIKSWLYTLVN